MNNDRPPESRSQVSCFRWFNNNLTKLLIGLAFILSLIGIVLETIYSTVTYEIPDVNEANVNLCLKELHRERYEKHDISAKDFELTLIVFGAYPFLVFILLLAVCLNVFKQCSFHYHKSPPSSPQQHDHHMNEQTRIEKKNENCVHKNILKFMILNVVLCIIGIIILLPKVQETLKFNDCMESMVTVKPIVIQIYTIEIVALSLTLLFNYDLCIFKAFLLIVLLVIKIILKCFGLELMHRIVEQEEETKKTNNDKVRKSNFSCGRARGGGGGGGYDDDDDEESQITCSSMASSLEQYHDNEEGFDLGIFQDERELYDIYTIPETDSEERGVDC